MNSEELKKMVERAKKQRVTYVSYKDCWEELREYLKDCIEKCGFGYNFDSSGNCVRTY